MKPKIISVAISNLLAGALLLTQSLWADPLDTWTRQTNGLPSCGFCNEQFSGVTFGAGLFVAVGSSVVATSYNGTNWTTRPATATTNDVTNNFSSVTFATFGSGLFLACGTNGSTGASAIFTSTNGTNWVDANAFQNPVPVLAGIAYGSTVGGLVFVAVGPEGTVLISTNGVNWAESGPGGNGIPASETLVGVVYGNGVFVAVGTSGNDYVSPDGETWRAYPIPLIHNVRGGNPMTCIAYGDGQFVAVAEYGNPISTSTDGINWVRAANQSSSVNGWPYNGIAYGKDQFVVVGQADGDNPDIISATNSSPPSPSLVWVSRFAPSSNLGSLGSLNSVTYGNGLWVGVGSSDVVPLVMTSGALPSVKSGTYPGLGPVRAVGLLHPDSLLPTYVAVGDNGMIQLLMGGTPYLEKSPTTNQLRGVADALIDFVAVGANGTILDSPDGTNWTETPSPTTNSLDGVASGNGLDVAVGADGTVVTSLDDTNWTSAPALGTNDLVSIAFGNGQFEALSTNGMIFLSVNGTNWTTNSLALPASASQLNFISFANGQFTATDTNGDVLTSTNGISYDLLLTSSSATTGINGASLVNGNLLLIGSGGTILTVQFPIAGTGTTENLYAVAYNGTIYAAVGEAGTIITSPDASAWTAPANYVGTVNTLDGITYGNGLFVGVGVGGWIVTSPDGNNWTSTSSGVTVANLNAIAYGAGQFVAVGDGGTIITSSGGLDWTVADSGDTATLEGIAFANGEFVVSDTSGNSLVSTDGVHWNAGPSTMDSYVDGVAGGNGVFVIVDQAGEIFSSTDGLNWVEQAAPQLGLFGVAYGSGTFVATGINGTILVSPNGTNWTQVQTSVTDPYLYAVVAGNSQFVIVGTDGTSLSASQDALASLPPDTTWNLVNSTVTGTLTSVASSGQLYAVISSDPGSDVVSTDGVTWTVQGIGLNQDGAGVNWVNGIFAAVDQFGGIYTSPDGTNWTQQANTGVSLSAVGFGGGVYVATAVSGEVFTSSDSIHWSPHETGLTGDLEALTYANGQFVVVASDGTVATSAKGTNWTSQTSPAPGDLNAITYADGLYVAVGGAGTIITSPDSIQWTLQTNAPITAATLNAIAWGNNEFMAVGTDGWTIRSADGTNWISSSSATVNNLRSIIFANDRFLAVGDAGTIMETPVTIPSRLGPIVLRPDSGIQITLQGTTNSSYVIQVSTDLINWTDLTGIALTGTNAGQFTDSAVLSPNQPQRFYRAVVAP